MQLAREFGHIDYMALLSSLSVLEFDRWYAHFVEHPFKVNLIKYYGGQVCASIYNASLSFKPISPQEFDPSYVKPEQSFEDQAAMWSAMAE